MKRKKGCMFTAEEIKIIEENPMMTGKELAELLDGRSVSGINQWRYRHGQSRDRHGKYGRYDDLYWDGDPYVEHILDKISVQVFGRICRV